MVNVEMTISLINEDKKNLNKAIEFNKQFFNR